MVVFVTREQTAADPGRSQTECLVLLRAICGSHRIDSPTDPGCGGFLGVSAATVSLLVVARRRDQMGARDSRTHGLVDLRRVLCLP